LEVDDHVDQDEGIHHQFLKDCPVRDFIRRDAEDFADAGFVFWGV
jgi:hypothetical protein